MHFMRGFNIGKKIFKILGKELKLKIIPINLTIDEKENLLINNNNDENLLHVYVRTPVSKYSPVFFKQNDIREKESFKYLIRNICLNTNQLFFLYFTMKNKYNKTNKPSTKKYILGCSLKLNNVGKKGMKVVSVKSESPAEKADLRPNDIILKIQSINVRSIQEFNKIIQNGEEMKNIEISRNEQGTENIFRLTVQLSQANLN